MNRSRFSTALLVWSAALLLLSCSLSLNINGPGSEPATSTPAPVSVKLALQRTLTALAQPNEENSGASGSTPDGTLIADNVNTLVAQALATLQPTTSAGSPKQTRPPARPTHTPLPPTAEIIIATPTPLPTNTPLPTDTPTYTPTFSPTPTNTFTPTIVPTHCPQEFCIIMQRCDPGENTRAVGTIYEHDQPVNGVRVRVSYAMGGPPVIPDFISGNDPNNPGHPDPRHPGYYQLGLLEGGALAGNWWVFVVNDQNEVLSPGHLFNTQGQETGTSCQVGITDFYR